MDYICVRHEKIKTGKTALNTEAEHDRKDHFAKRDNVIENMTQYNRRASNFKNESIEEMFQQQKNIYNKKHKRKLRKDAVHCIDSVFIKSSCSVSESKLLLTAAARTMQRIAPNCPIKMWSHCDELGQAHVHSMLVPINTDGECITDQIMRKEALQSVQDIFAEECNNLGLSCRRGKSKKERFEQGLEQVFHKDNFAFLNSDEGKKWLEEKDKLKEKKLAEISKLENRVSDLQNQAKAFGSKFDNEDISIDALIEAGRF